MANKIIFNYSEMDQAARDLDARAEDYRQAYAVLKTALNSAIADWTGESKDAIVAFFYGPCTSFMNESVPTLVEGFANLLRSNAVSMQDTDRQIAEKINAQQNG